MTKLKTLKDLPNSIDDSKFKEFHDFNTIFKGRIKAEAINWVKAFDLKRQWAEYKTQDIIYIPKPERDLTKIEEQMLKNIYEQSFRTGVIRMNNITSEDLK